MRNDSQELLSKQPYPHEVLRWMTGLLRRDIKSKKRTQTCPSSHGNVIAIHKFPELEFLKAKYTAEPLAGGADNGQSDRSTEGKNTHTKKGFRIPSVTS